MKRDFYFVLSFVSFFILVSILGEANTDQVYIVYMGASTSQEGGAPRTDHVQLLNEHTKRKKNSVVHIYNKSLLGFVARMSEQEARLIAQRPGVVSVFPDSMLQLHTTRSWDFLMSQTAFKNNIDTSSISSHSNISNWSSGGRDSIIGIFDTGIWPQHQSFNDTRMGPIPKRWKGICMTGGNSTAFKCNRKVIGARYYDNPGDPGLITTAMDEDGHGTHVASIAAGMPVSGASYYGLATGVSKGGSPGSRIAVYRVCGTEECSDSSIFKAFDDAIADGVDVISISIGGPTESFDKNVIALGAFHAAEKGVIVVASAGNSGPRSGTLQNYSPWILTVGATTMDRDFQVGIVLSGKKEVIKGGGINFSGLNKSPVYRLVNGRSVGHDRHDLFNATHCIPGSLDGAMVKGRIVLCYNNDRVSIFDKIDAMIEQGVIGIIMIDNSLRQLAYNFLITIAFAAVSETDGAQIQSYINTRKNPLATMLPTEAMLHNKPAPVVAFFSSRGPTPGIKNLIKPDVTAPGVDIIAAWRFNDTSEAYPGMEPPVFDIASGTSMSCPHVCGDHGCASSSILKAFDNAIADGVDVISISLGDRYKSFLTDPVAIGAFHAMENGVTVVASVANDGPSSETIQNFSPWILSVGATTIDRDFQVGIVLGRRNKVIKGGGINFSGLNKSPVYRLVDGRSVGHDRHDLFNATHYIPGSLDGAKVKGRIVLCYNNDCVSIFDKIDAMIEQGVIGIIMIDNSLRQLAYNFLITIAFAAVSETDGAQIQSYIKSTKNPSATMLPTEAMLHNKPAPVVAFFSSRGPTPGIKNLIKPDVTAPGVDIIAAWPFNDTSEAYPGMEPPVFDIASGTSMSCPHVSGVAATVKSWHPTWSPSFIKSAIMTTAIPTNNDNAPITTLTGSRATPYDIGSGEISLFSPWFPGLVYETETTDYILFLCNLGYNTSVIKYMSSTLPNNFSCPINSSYDSISDLNYPSIAVFGLIPNLRKTVKRTVTNVGQSCSTYKVEVEAPAGVRVEVVPNMLHFTKNVNKLSFQVTFTRTTSIAEDLFGSITWLSSNHFYMVRSPFVVSNA